MTWPPAGSSPGEVLLYYWLLWFLLVVGPVAIWIAIYYLRLKHRWDPHFRMAQDELGRDRNGENSNGNDGSYEVYRPEKSAVRRAGRGAGST